MQDKSLACSGSWVGFSELKLCVESRRELVKRREGCSSRQKRELKPRLGDHMLSLTRLLVKISRGMCANHLHVTGSQEL